MAAGEKLRFAGFELDQQTHELLRNGRAVKLAPQALRLLEFLASRPGRLLTREEIRHEIWSETTFVDFELGINKSIRQIRDALYASGNGWHRDMGDFVGTVRALLEAGATLPNDPEALELSDAVLEVLP